METDGKPVFWLLDTRPLWNGHKIDDSVISLAPLVFPPYILLMKHQAPEALRLLNDSECAKARKFHFLRDAKLSVGSALLKRLFIRSTLNEPWNSIHFTREGDPVHGKPCQKTTNGQPPLVDFNVTHQAGLVALVGCMASQARVGIDIVCVDERRESQMIKREGLEKFVDMHEEVFSDADMSNMKNNDLNDGERLRRFFAYWALKEAYIKLVGEGLLAQWLKYVEFRNVRYPRPATGPRAFGETMSNIEVWRNGRKVDDVELSLQAFEDKYMVAVAVQKIQPLSSINPEFVLLDVEEDIYTAAKS